MNVHRILVLDDDVGVCTVLTRILEDRHYVVHTSQSVASAGETLSETTFDAYLLDYWLSDGTGLQVAEKIRQLGSTAPIILISGYGTTDISAKAAVLGIFEVLQKPFARQAICDTLEKALNHTPEPLAPEAVTTPTPEPSSRFQLGPSHIILVAFVIVFVALCIFLLFR
jgi:two-component system response regulator HydG